MSENMFCSTYVDRDYYFFTEYKYVFACAFSLLFLITFFYLNMFVYIDCTANIACFVFNVSCVFASIMQLKVYVMLFLRISCFLNIVLYGKLNHHNKDYSSHKIHKKYQNVL